MLAVESLLSLYLCNDTSVYVAVFQCLVYVFCLHFRNTNIQLGVLVHKLWKEARNKVRGDGGQYGNVESSRKRMPLFFNNFFQLLCPYKNIPSSLYNEHSFGSWFDGLLASVEYLYAQFFFQFLNH